MILQIVNLTGSTKTYLSGSISVSGNSTFSVTPTTNQFSLTLDGQLHSDIANGFIQLSDGVTNYAGNDAITYLDKVNQRFGPTSDSFGNQIGSISSAGVNNLLIGVGATNYALSSVNSSTSQLAAGATFTGGIENTFNQQSYSILATSDQPGILTINQYIDITGTMLGGSQSFNILAGIGFARSGVVNGNFVNVTFRNIGTGTTTTFNLNTAYGTIPSSTQLNNFPISLDEAGGIALTATPYGNLSISTESTALFSDTFDSSGFDTTNRWNTPVTAVSGSTTQSLGVLSLITTTSASSAAAISSQFSFSSIGINFINLGVITQIESSILTNTHRFWGFGTPNSSYTASTPLLNAIGFEIDTSGNLNGVIYSSGTKIVSKNLNLYKSYITGTPGVLALVMRADSVYWFVGTTNVPVASSFLSTPDSYSFPLRFHTINHTTPPASVPTFKIQALGVGDSGGNGLSISDGQFQWRKLKVNADGSINTATTQSLQLANGQLFTASTQVIAATGSADNPLVLFRNPNSNIKTMFIKKILLNVEVINIIVTYKIFGNPTLTNTVSTITNITQPGLGTTVTVTTSTANGATVGATVVITGTTNFNGTYTVASVTSSTIYTFTKSAPLLTTTNTSGTSTMSSSLGTVLTSYPLKRVASPTLSTAILTTSPTVPSNGDQLIVAGNGQNAGAISIIDSEMISLEPGQNLIIAANPASNNRSVTVTIIWSEI